MAIPSRVSSAPKSSQKAQSRLKKTPIRSTTPRQILAQPAIRAKTKSIRRKKASSSIARAENNRVRKTLDSLRKVKNQKNRSRTRNLTFSFWVTIGILIILGLILCFNYLLPYWLPLDESRSILILNSDQNQPQFLLNFDPEIKKITRVQVDPAWWQANIAQAQQSSSENSSSPLSLTSENALSSSSSSENTSSPSLLTLENAPPPPSEILIAPQNLGFYSLIFNQVIDEIYLINSPLEISTGYENFTTRRDIAQFLRQQWWQKLYQTGYLDLEILRLDLFTRSTASYYLNDFILNTETQGKWQTSFNLAKQPHLNCSLVVVNSTNTSGLATKLANLWQNDGWSVTRTGNYQDFLEKTTIYYQPNQKKDCQKLLDRSSRLLPITPQFIEDEALVNQYRAQVVVIIGQDLVAF